MASEIDTQQLELVGTLEGVQQRVLLAPAALTYMRRHRQTMPWAREAGGQLFGTIDTAQVFVRVATGPYRGDERSRYRYRSNPKAAQSAIDEQAKNGLLYLGEWHTHAEDQPDSSGLDDEAMLLLIKRSKLNSNSLLMLIVGRDLAAAGLGLWSMSTESLVRWQLGYLWSDTLGSSPRD